MVSQNMGNVTLEDLIHPVIPYMHEYFLVHHVCETYWEGESRTNVSLTVKETRVWVYSEEEICYWVLFKLFPNSLNYCVNIALEGVNTKNGYQLIYDKLESTCVLVTTF